jgi:hypothetical protein
VAGAKALAERQSGGCTDGEEEEAALSHAPKNK